MARAIEEGAEEEDGGDPFRGQGEAREGGGPLSEARRAEVVAVLRDGIAHHPKEVELYLTLGHALERRGDGEAALLVYCSFPPPPHGAPPSFDHAMAASQTAKLLIQRGDDGRLRCATRPDQIEGDEEIRDRIPLLVESLVVVGRRLGVLNIEKYVAALDLADQVEAIKEIYYRISPNVDQSTFFRHKGWDVRGGM